MGHHLADYNHFLSSTSTYQNLKPEIPTSELTLLQVEFALVCPIHQQGLEVYPFDASSDAPPAFEGIDLVISMEVEHSIPEAKSDHYLDLLCSFEAKAIVFSADRPGGGDRLALNEKPGNWWIGKFGRRGYLIEEGTTRHWQRDWKKHKIPHWLYENVMLLRRQEIG